MRPGTKAVWIAVLCVVALRVEPSRGERMRGLLVVAGDRTVAQDRADQLFTPASLQKLVVVTAALHYLGHDRQIETVLRADGPIGDGALRGDLVLEAAGDPTWSSVFFPEDPSAPFRALAEQVHRAGIARVEGDLVLDLGRFPGRRAPSSRSQLEMGLAVGAPVSGLAIDENTAEVRIAAGGRIGERASVTSKTGIDLRNDTTTVDGTRHGKGSVEFLPVWGDGTVRVVGEYPISEPAYSVRVSLPAPERVVGERLREHLRAAGVELTGAVRVETRGGVARRTAAAGGGDVPADDPTVVAKLHSPPLSDIVVPVLRDSSNWTAEMLVLQVALVRTGAGRYDDGVEALETFLTEVVGLADTQFALDDVSGLSPENLLSPRAVVRLLQFAWHSPWRDAFVGALARPGSGTLLAWPPLPPLAGKTGTLKHTLALAGVLDPGTAAAPEWLAVPADATPAEAGAAVVAAPPAEPIFFAVFLNHDLRDRAEQRREIGDLLRLWRRSAHGIS
jgi:D-alanyl-D-alanine carboxypeptidase/D-alanyl-D-alanine-endopeptidase (penicillin-binding protein 4)